jgi:uncharacterized iron-regulated membrane protein
VKQLRKVVFWMHLVTAVSAGLVVLLMSVTGVLLAYQRQITAWADTRGLDAGPPAPGAARLAPDALLARVAQAAPGQPTSLKWAADAQAPAQVAFGRERTLFVSAYTGAVLGEGSARTRGFFRKVVALHRWIGGQEEAARERGKRITGAANLAFLFIVISGFYLWFPRNWTRRALRNVTWFRRGLPGKARDFNWHNTIGFWSSVPLFVIVLSGVVISYPWASNLVYRVMGDEPPAPVVAEGGGAPGAGGERPGAPAGQARGGRGAQAGAVPLDGLGALAATAERQVQGWRTITLTLPKKGDEPVAFNIDRGDGGQPQKRASLSLDRRTGAAVKWESFPDQKPGRRMRSILRFAHTGEVLGLFGQTLAALVSLGAAFLVYTGFALTWRRFRAWRAPRRVATGSRRVEAVEETVSA